MNPPEVEHAKPNNASSTLSLDAEAIAQRTAALVLAGFDQLIFRAREPQLLETVNFKQLQAMLGTKSRAATYRRAKALGLRPYAQGAWRYRAVQNAIANADVAARHGPTKAMKPR